MNQKYYDTERYKRIIEVIKKKNFSFAKKMLDEYKKDYPNDSSILPLEMRYYNEIGEYQKVKIMGNKAIQTDFHSPISLLDSYYEAALANWALKEDKEAIRLLEESLSIYDKAENYRAYAKLVIIYIIKEEYDKAENLLEKHKDFSEEFYELNKARIEFYKGDNDAVIHRLSQLNENRRGGNTYIKEEKYYYLGTAYYNKNDFDMAEDCYRKVINGKDEISYKVLAKLVKLEMSLGKYDDALNHAYELYKNQNFQLDAMNCIGRCYYEQGKYEEAVKEYSKISNLEYRYSGLGRTYMAMGDLETAYDYLCKGLNVEDASLKKHNELLIKLAICCIRRNREDLANYLCDCIDWKLNREDVNYNNLKFYLKWKSENSIPMESHINYSQMQMMDYQEEAAKNHVQRRHYNTDNSELTTSFKENCDIDELFLYSKDKIKDLTPRMDNFTDVYVIDIENPEWVIKPEKFDKIQVVTLMGTDKIITLFPVSKDGILRETEEEVNIPKRKKLSKIDKFRQKYGDKY